MGASAASMRTLGPCCFFVRGELLVDFRLTDAVTPLASRAEQLPNSSRPVLQDRVGRSGALRLASDVEEPCGGGAVVPRAGGRTVHSEAGAEVGF